MKCLMFSRHDAFCSVCRDAVEAIIDLYSKGDRAGKQGQCNFDGTGCRNIL
jgi:hypothetical protein